MDNIYTVKQKTHLQYQKAESTFHFYLQCHSSNDFCHKI